MSALRRLMREPHLVTIGHYAPWPIVTLAVAARVAEAMHRPVLSWVLWVGLIVVFAGHVAHAMTLCPRGGCAVLISAAPAESAQRHHSWLRHAHRPLTSWTTWTVIVMWLLASMSGLPVLSGLATGLFLYVEVRSARLHSRLRPWCPWCSHGGGSDRHVPAEPAPTGGVSRDQ